MRNIGCLLAISLVMHLAAVAQSTLPAGIPPANFHLYVLAGQSNMAGRGKVDTTDNAPHPRVWMLNKDNQWVPATDPMHFDKPAVVGVGPGLSFGKKLAQQDTGAADAPVFIGLIPTAVGGSPIDAWQPGAYYDQTRSHPYDDAVKRVQLAQQSGTLYGILWHQGESDSKPELVPAYKQKLVQLIGRFRQVFSSPNVPVVVGTLGDFFVAKTPASAQINDILRDLPKHESKVACVDASGLTDNGDQTHFNTESARELGRRYATAMQTLQSIKK